MTEEDASSSPPPSTSSDHPAFDLLDRGVQRQLYAMKWPALRPIQAESIKTYLGSDSDLLLMAETAAGKTEAAFLPILSSIADEPIGSVRTVYVGPLKALINDQFSRVEMLCTHLEMPVHRWHGDVGATQKEALVKRPGGVLLITPESLESLLINRTAHLASLFGGLRAIVIDELHAFLAGERGLHLASLLSRIARYRRPDEPRARLIGLSATIGDPLIAQRYLNPAQPGHVAIITDQGASAEIRFRVHGYDAVKLRTDRLDKQDGTANLEDDLEPDALVMAAIAEDLVEHCRTHSNLVFANAKGDIEILADMANEAARDAGIPESFLVHHGSLSKDVREDAEEQMKSGRPRTTICSSTLEMGIDIGSVRLVGQIGAPWSVASLKQRMGRSGRKPGEPRRLRCFVDCTTHADDSNPLSLLPIELLQTIAVCDLMLEGWVEPPESGQLDLSTLTHQIISTIAETGALTASELNQRLCREGPFGNVPGPILVRLLRALGGADIIEQGADDKLILGLVGEKLRARRDFYAAFASRAEYSVITGTRVLGTLPIDALPKEGDHIVFAARRWQIASVDTERQELHVTAAKRRKRPKFLGGVGRVHQRVVDRMMHLLAAESEVPYLDATATESLAAARLVAKEYRLAERRRVSLNSKNCLWLTWTGTAETMTYEALLASHGVEARREVPGLVCGCSMGDLESLLAPWRNQTPDMLTLAEHVHPKQRRKYDAYFPDELLEEGIATSLRWRAF